MPTYGYVCDSCGYRKEEYRNMSERDSPLYCPGCKKKMERLLGVGSGFKIDGGGVYKPGWSMTKGKNEK